jgi:RecA-family ATPase
MRDERTGARGPAQDDQFASLMPEAARRLLGEPNRQHSNRNELRFGTNGSLSIKLRDGTWFDHEHREGGGLLALIRRKTGRNDPIEWLREQGFDVAAKPKSKPRSKIVATYDYHDDKGNLLYQVVRYEPKSFSQRRPGIGGNGWISGLGGIAPTLYHLPELLADMREPREEQSIWLLTEGEKDADNLVSLGFFATTNSGGASNFHPELAEHFRDARDVVILEDSDVAGAARTAAIAPMLLDVGARVRVLRIADHHEAKPKDITKWFELGGTPEQLFAILDKLGDWEPAPAAEEPSNDNGGTFDPGPLPHGEPEKPIEPFETFDAGDWQGQPIEPRRWVVHHRIPCGEPGIVSGDGGTGKTLLMLQLAVAVAAEWPDWVNGVIETRGPVLVFSAEEKLQEMRRRVGDILAHRGFDFDAVRGRLRFICDPDEVALGMLDRNGMVVPTLSLHRLEKTVERIKPVLVVIENAAEVYPANEIVRAPVARFVRKLLGGLAAPSDAGVGLIQHPSVAGLKEASGRSGSTGWNNACRWRLNFTRIQQNGVETDMRQLEVVKSNYGPIGEKVEVYRENGVFVPVKIGSPMERAAAAAPIDDAFLACLDAATQQGRDVHVTTGRGYAPSVFAAMPQAKGNTSKALEGAMQRLLNDGKIRNEPYGSASKGTKRLVRCYD